MVLVFNHIFFLFHSHPEVISDYFLTKSKDKIPRFVQDKWICEIWEDCRSLSYISLQILRPDQVWYKSTNCQVNRNTGISSNCTKIPYTLLFPKSAIGDILHEPRKNNIFQLIVLRSCRILHGPYAHHSWHILHA